MHLPVKRIARSVVSALPRRIQNAILGASPELQRSRFERFIEIERLRRLLTFLEVDCILDIGANVGQYATMLRRQVGFRGRIISFEPTPQLADILRTKARADPLWSVEEIAVSDIDGRTTLHTSPYSEFNSLSPFADGGAADAFHRARATQTVEVTCRCLETVIASVQSQHAPRAVFLKMDTQGYDMRIARGGTVVLDRFVGIQSELAIRAIYDSCEDLGSAISFFQSNGFELSALVPNNAGHFPLLYEVDGLFIRSDLAR